MASDPYPIFILTMRGDEARRAPLEGWLREHDLDYQLFFGVDGRRGLAQEWEASIDRAAAAERLGRKMGDGEFATALSHQEIYRAVLERGLPGAVVLEDDAVPGQGFAQFIHRRAYHLAPMILLDHSNTRVAPGGVLDLGGGLLGHRVSLPPFLATAYSLSVGAAAEMRKRSFPIGFVADWPCDISRIGAVAAMPRPVDHPRGATRPSHLDDDRRMRQRRGGRFLKLDYWRRWLRKRASVRLPDAE